MRKMLATFVLAVAFLAPPQIVLAQEESDFMEVLGRIEMTQMKLQRVKEMMMHPSKKMSASDMKKIKKMLRNIERELQHMIDIGGVE